jgi:hypothetical protein
MNEKNGKIVKKFILTKDFHENMYVVFVCSLSEFDELSFEDDEKNRLKESIKIFGEVVNNPLFKKIPIFLIFTKKDIFEKKILNIDLNVTFHEYNDGKDPLKSFEFIKNQFLGQDRNDPKRIIIKKICTLDRKEVSNVLEDIFGRVQKNELLKINF